VAGKHWRSCSEEPSYPASGQKNTSRTQTRRHYAPSNQTGMGNVVCGGGMAAKRTAFAQPARVWGHAPEGTAWGKGVAVKRKAITTVVVNVGVIEQMAGGCRGVHRVKAATTHA